MGGASSLLPHESERKYKQRPKDGNSSHSEQFASQSFHNALHATIPPVWESPTSVSKAMSAEDKFTVAELLQKDDSAMSTIICTDLAHTPRANNNGGTFISQKLFDGCGIFVSDKNQRNNFIKYVKSGLWVKEITNNGVFVNQPSAISHGVQISPRPQSLTEDNNCYHFNDNGLSSLQFSKVAGANINNNSNASSPFNTDGESLSSSSLGSSNNNINSSNYVMKNVIQTCFNDEELKSVLVASLVPLFLSLKNKSQLLTLLRNPHDILDEEEYYRDAQEAHERSLFNHQRARDNDNSDDDDDENDENSNSQYTQSVYGSYDSRTCSLSFKNNSSNNNSRQVADVRRSSSHNSVSSAASQANRTNSNINNESKSILNNRSSPSLAAESTSSTRLLNVNNHNNYNDNNIDKNCNVSVFGAIKPAAGAAATDNHSQCDSFHTCHSGNSSTEYHSYHAHQQANDERELWMQEVYTSAAESMLESELDALLSCGQWLSKVLMAVENHPFSVMVCEAPSQPPHEPLSHSTVPASDRRRVATEEAPENNINNISSSSKYNIKYNNSISRSRRSDNKKVAPLFPVIYVNKAHGSLTLHKKEEVLGKTCRLIRPPVSRAPQWEDDTPPQAPQQQAQAQTPKQQTRAQQQLSASSGSDRSDDDDNNNNNNSSISVSGESRNTISSSSTGGTGAGTGSPRNKSRNSNSDDNKINSHISSSSNKTEFISSSSSSSSNNIEQSSKLTQIQDAFHQAKPLQVVLTSQRRDGTDFLNLITLRPVFSQPDTACSGNGQQKSPYMGEALPPSVTSVPGAPLPPVYSHMIVLQYDVTANSHTMRRDVRLMDDLCDIMSHILR